MFQRFWQWTTSKFRRKPRRGWVSPDEWRGEHVTFKRVPELKTFVDSEGHTTHYLPGIGHFPGRRDT